MTEEIVIAGGPTIHVRDRPPQGTRHRLVFGVLADSGAPVAVKLERAPGALAREFAALTALGPESRLLPRLMAFGHVSVAGDPVACIVTERRPGVTPTTINGWRRMGRALGSLANLGCPESLSVTDHARLGREHRQRVSELGDRLDRFIASPADRAALTAPQVSGPLVVTHGDPGPGNFVDDGAEGTLIDWEDAHIAPRGLDLARLRFIALLGAGPEGYAATDHRERAEAATEGYLAAIEDPWSPSREESRAWTAVAGVQFIHRRWRQGGRPGPWEEAATVLGSALDDRRGLA